MAAGHNWRWFYGALGAIGVLNLGLAVLTLPSSKPFKPDMRFDRAGLALGILAVVLPFWASGELAGHGFVAAPFAAPMFVGLVCFVVLLLTEYHQQEPLSPVKPMWTTQSVTGTLVAMIGGGVFVAFLELAERFHMQVAHQTPLQTGLMLWPLAPAALIAAAAFGVIVRTWFVPLLILAGMASSSVAGRCCCSCPAGARPRSLPPGSWGLGAGATVSPGLYMAGFPLPSQIIGRVFALVELVRSLADYIIAPVIAQIAQERSARQLDAQGVHLGVWVTLWLTIAFTLGGAVLYVLGRGGLPRPALEGWLANRNPAIPSTPLLARLRSNG